MMKVTTAMRAARRASLLFSCIGFCIGIPVLAAAQGASPAAFSETYGDWNAVCIAAAQPKPAEAEAPPKADEPPKAAAPPKAVRQCFMQQRLAWRGKDSDRSHTILTVTMRAPRPGGEFDIAILTPFGLLLDTGATLRVDKAQPLLSLRFLTCLDGQGCILRGRLDAEAAKVMEKGRFLFVEMLSRNRRPFKVGVSLRGFTDAFSRLRTATAP